MTAGIFILLYSVAILVSKSLICRGIMLISDITLKTRFFLSITSHSYLYYVLRLPALIDWMVQRTSLMKPSGAGVLDKAVQKSGSLYACLINRETIKLKTSYIISN